MSNNRQTAVYFLIGRYNDKDHIFKIGHSCDVSKRVYILNREYNFELQLFGTLYFDSKKEACRVERDLQKILTNFQKKHFSREWFEPTEEVINFATSLVFS